MEISSYYSFGAGANFGWLGPTGVDDSNAIVTSYPSGSRKNKYGLPGQNSPLLRSFPPGFFHSFGSAIDIFWIDKVKSRHWAIKRRAGLKLQN
jgi:hypothetical protein